VDFILYGPRGFIAFEITKTGKINSTLLAGLKSFLADYPIAKAYLVYGGARRMHEERIEIVPVEEMLKDLKAFL